MESTCVLMGSPDHHYYVQLDLVQFFLLSSVRYKEGKFLVWCAVWYYAWRRCHENEPFNYLQVIAGIIGFQSYLTVSSRLNYCRSWLIVSAVLLITYSVHIFSNGRELPIALLLSLAALVYRVFAIAIVYGLLLHLEETVRPFFSTVDGVYLEYAYKDHRPTQAFGFEHYRSV